MAKLRTADLIAQRLFEAGVRHAFGIPGGEVLTLIDALEAVGIEFIVTKHENCAGFMAEGTHHMTGAPAVLVATVGPGVANAFNAIANADQDRVPLIVLTGRIDQAEAVTYSHQVFDHSAALMPVTKASFTVPDGNVDALIDKAVAIAMDDRPGPVHLDVPIAIAEQIHQEAMPVRRAEPAASRPADGPDLDWAREKLRDAKRPLILAGLDAIRHNAGPELEALARKFGTPVLTTYKAKGIFPEDDPLSLGGAGLSPTADQTILPLIESADFLLLAGYDPIEMRASWTNAWDADEQFVVEISAVPDHQYVHQATLSFTCHVGEGLNALAEADKAGDVWQGGEIAAAKEALAGAFGQNDPWGPAAIVETVRAALPRDGVATVDTGAHRILLSQVWESYGTHEILQSTGLCTMGVALPLAMGVKIAEPSRPVVAFSGDGGLEMVLGELATTRDLKLPIVIVVFVDASLSLIELKQRAMGLANAGVDVGETDFVAVAKAMGGRGVLCEDRETLDQAVREGLAADTFTICACKIPRKSYDGRL